MLLSVTAFHCAALPREGGYLRSISSAAAFKSDVLQWAEVVRNRKPSSKKSLLYCLGLFRVLISIRSQCLNVHSNFNNYDWDGRIKRVFKNKHSIRKEKLLRAAEII